MAQDNVILKTVRLFLSGPLSGIFIAAALCAGIVALILTPREEDPQIIVPMADVEVSFPGHSPEECEQLVTRPLERLLWQLDGVEHVYSSSSRDGCMVTVRFYVGEDRDRSMVRLRDKIEENLNLVPAGVQGWRILPVSINDVPIVCLTLSGENYDSLQLRRFAEELSARLDSVPDISRSEVFGGLSRQIRIEPQIEYLRAMQMSLPELGEALRLANAGGTVGYFLSEGREQLMLTGTNPVSAQEVANIVVKEEGGRLLRLGDVARVIDGAQRPESYVRHNGQEAVTLALSKKAGVNAVSLARKIIVEAEKIKAATMPADLELTVTRDQGRSADERVSGLISGMFFAVLTVILLIALTMGWRESVVIGFSVPVSFALALFTNYLFGYTLNRVTLFALILSLGLVVDDPITNVDNVQRHIRLGRLSPRDATLYAVKEVLPPVIMSTVAIIVSFTPMFFISGMMGPYMGPMAINVPLTVSFSTVCALTFVPFLALKLLQKRAGELKGVEESEGAPLWVRRLYGGMIRPFLRRSNAWLLIVVVLLLTCASALLMFFKVPLKMLPFDSRDELQVLLKLPPGATDEDTQRLVFEVEGFLARQNEVLNYQSYVGLASPIDFNGLVRHYRMRNGSNQADIRINLLPKAERRMSSHDLALRFRDPLNELAEPYGALLNIVEVPPGPPVLATMTAEVYGEPGMSYEELQAGARELQKRLHSSDARHFAEIDTMNDYSPQRLIFQLDADKAALNGVALGDITQCLGAALSGAHLGDLRLEGERQPLNLVLRLSYEDRHSLEKLSELTIKGRNGSAVPLAELGRFVPASAELPIMHKNLERVVFVTAECVGRAPGEMILQTQFQTLKKEPLPEGISVKWAGEGEWEITLRVFRDLGLAFAVALAGIFLLLIVQTSSISLSLVMMCAIPLTIIGIAPGFWLLNLLAGSEVGGYSSPIFFTATGMIGMIALGGIVIRNAIVLIEFIEENVARGEPLRKAISEAGAVRFRPIMLTAITTLMGAWPITLDPIFSGLAWALIFGLLASTFFTMLVIPSIYLLLAKDNVESEAH
ncbi:MAG: efflux RND transporter permease subunit [Lentisphaeria bacterium]|nr:efflux RND transporter permease subunit [Lentisphaeria bacterium]